MKIALTLDLTIEDDINPDVLVQALVDLCNGYDNEWPSTIDGIRYINSVDNGQWALADDQ